MKAGLIGCGDYLRWVINHLNNSQHLRVKYTFDLDRKKSEAIAARINATVVDSETVIFNDPEVEIVMIYTPPWIRKDLFRKAADSGKHIITTKPLAPNARDAEYLYQTVKDRVECAVFYGRTGNAGVEKLKTILDSGEVGQLAVYKEDWLHHYPQWNDWATDPEKNGGPFMDAMVHNLNKSRYLIGSPVKSLNFFSENYTQSLKCNDTEFMKINFENGSSSWLFITWAADLEVYDKTGNNREHYGILHMITSQGWYITEEQAGPVKVIKAKKENLVKTWEIPSLEHTPYDEVAFNIMEGKPQKFDIVPALSDIRIIDFAVKNVTPPYNI